MKEVVQFQNDISPSDEQMNKDLLNFYMDMNIDFAKEANKVKQFGQAVKNFASNHPGVTGAGIMGGLSAAEAKLTKPSEQEKKQWGTKNRTLRYALGGAASGALLGHSIKSLHNSSQKLKASRMELDDLENLGSKIASPKLLPPHPGAGARAASGAKRVFSKAKEKVKGAYGKASEGVKSFGGHAKNFAIDHPVATSIGGGTALGATIGATAEPRKGHTRAQNIGKGALGGALAGLTFAPAAHILADEHKYQAAKNFVRPGAAKAYKKQPGERAHRIDNNTDIIMGPPKKSNIDPNFGPPLKTANLAHKVLAEGKSIAKHIGGGAITGSALTGIRATGANNDGPDGTPESLGSKAKRIGNALGTGAIYGATTGAGVYGIRGLAPAKKHVAEGLAHIKTAFNIESATNGALNVGKSFANDFVAPNAAKAKAAVSPHISNITNHFIDTAKSNPSLVSGLVGATAGAGAGGAYTNDGYGAAAGALGGGLLGAKGGKYLLRESTHGNPPLLGDAVAGALKQANLISSGLQGAGKLLAKSPRLATAGAGALVGGAANKATGGDFTTGALAGGALGAVGGKRLLGAVSNKATPLLGKNIQQGAVGELKTIRAGQRAAQAGTVKALPAPSAAPMANPAAVHGPAPASAASVVEAPRPMPQAAAVNVQQPVHSTAPVATYNSPAVDVRAAPMSSPQPAMNARTTTSVAQPAATSAAATRAPTQNVSTIREAPKTNRIVAQGPKRGLDPSMLQENTGLLSGLNPISSKETGAVYDQMMAGRGRRALSPRFT